jgi:hypothetical protein
VPYPDGEQAAALALAARIGGAVSTQQSTNVSSLTLVVGPSAPAALIRPPAGTATPGATPTQDPNPSATTGGAPTATEPDPGSPGSISSITAESRDGDENICSDLPATVKYGGRP